MYILSESILYLDSTVIDIKNCLQCSTCIFEHYGGSKQCFSNSFSYIHRINTYTIIG